MLKRKNKKIQVTLRNLEKILSRFNVAGSTKAENTEEYYVADDYEGKIVVHQTTEYYILMPIKENKLEREYEIVPTSNIGHLSHKNTGRITLK